MIDHMPITEYADTIISPVGEVIVFSTCIILIILFYQGFVIRNAALEKLRCIVLLLMAASFLRLIQYLLMEYFPYPLPVFYVLRISYYLLIYACCVQYAAYLIGPLRLAASYRHSSFEKVPLLLITVLLITDSIMSYLGIGFHISSSQIYVPGYNIYVIACIIVLAGILYNIFDARKRLTGNIIRGLYCSTVMSMMLVILQMLFHNRYYLSFAMILPIFAVLMLFHTGSYNVYLGMGGSDIFYNQLDNDLEHKQTDIIYILYIKDIASKIKNNPNYKKAHQRFFNQTMQNSSAFLLNSSNIVYMCRKNEEYNILDETRHIEHIFTECFDNIHVKFRMFALETIPGITLAKEYEEIFQFMKHQIRKTGCHIMTDKDYKNFEKYKYILEQLYDIEEKNDPEDERVLAYCQPVYNVQTGSYDTAEALMRLKTEKYGIIFPDEFIPVAERNKLIHPLTMIILNKTCQFIKRTEKSGHSLKRITVNYSIQDLEHKDICAETQAIIKANQISCHKIGIEVTETQLITGFEQIEHKIQTLHELGMMIYLDDFGSGYSNLDRIMKIPFDTIKFDRSMIVEAEKNPDNRFIVSEFSKIFAKLNYNVLFEGIETYQDEKNCMNMNASYLQGYKYSKPVPIEDLEHFLP